MYAIRSYYANKTKAIIPVDIAGWPCDYNELMALVNENNTKGLFQPTSVIQEKLGRILIINDAAHSLGATYKGKNIGTEADVTIFSLHAVKNITTAEGGAICLNLPKPFNNSELYSELRMMSLNFQTKDALSKTKSGGWKYDIIGLGMKINLPDVNAAIGLAQIRQYPELLSKREHISNIYNKEFSKYNWAIVPPQISTTKESSYHIFALRISGISEEQRDEIIQEISNRDVAVNVHFIPLPMLSFFKGLGYDINNYPQAYANYSTEISLPIYPQLSDEEVEYVIQTVIFAYNKVIKKNDQII